MDFSRALSIVLALSIVCVTPVVFGDNEAADLAGQVTIRRTEYGVPHILAENERALGFGLAYAQAEDHMQSIMELILKARGEYALHFGPGKNDANIKSDLWNRQYRIYGRAAETYSRLDEDWRDMTEGFAAGLNYYIGLHRDELPEWVQPVTPYDVAAHGLTGIARFAFNRRRIVDRFVSALEGGEDVVVEPEDMGSNLWAFDGTRTKSGNTILMGNPHQPWSQVATYYETHLTIPGTINFYGATFIGRPVLTTGFNDYLGWTHTVNYPDLEEIYALDVDPERPDHYLFDGASVPLRREDVVIQVREDVIVTEPSVATLGNADITPDIATPSSQNRVTDASGAPAAASTALAPPTIRNERRIRKVEKTFWYSPLGPVIHRTEDKVYVLKSAAYDEFRFYQQWFRLEQSTSLDEFRAVLDDLIMPMFNIGYADRDGNIYYLWNGTVPDLPHASHDAVAVHAKRTGDVWTRVHPISELPQVLNPKGGYVMNSNSAPYFTNLHAPLDRFSYPGHFVDNRFSLRSQHSMHLIHNEDRFSLEDVVRLKHDMRAVLADRVKEDLLRELKKSEVSGELNEAAELLAAWDNTTTRESRGSVLFDEWWRVYTRGVGGRPEQQFAVQWQTSNPVRTPMGIKDTDAAVAAFETAVNDVKKRFGGYDVAWGEAHRMRFADGTDLPVGGSSGTMGAFRVVTYADEADGKRRARSGDSWVFAVEFSTPPKAYTVVAYSQSEIVGSPHYSDQAALYADNRMKRAAFTEDEIAAQLLEAYHPGKETRAKTTTD